MSSEVTVRVAFSRAVMSRWQTATASTSLCICVMPGETGTDKVSHDSQGSHIIIPLQWATLPDRAGMVIRFPIIGMFTINCM